MHRKSSCIIVLSCIILYFVSIRILYYLSLREPCLPLLCTLICIYVAQITCICFVYVLGMVWVLRTVEIVLYRACIERVHRRVTTKLFSMVLLPFALYSVHVLCRSSLSKIQTKRRRRMGQERPFEGRIRPLRAGILVSLAAVAPLFLRLARWR